MLLETFSKHEPYEPFSDPAYLHEVKFNGIRLIYTKNANGHVELFTRHRTQITKKFPEVVITGLPNDSILDGELVCFHKGRDNFSKVMNRFRLSNNRKIEEAVLLNPSTFMVFDVLRWEGQQMTHLPLTQRKELLEKHFVMNPHTKMVDYRLTDGISLFQEVEERQQEGIVSKRLESRYLVGKRSTKGDWIKIISWTYVEEAWITGYRNDKFGLLCSERDELTGIMRPLGIVEFGLTREQKVAFFNIVSQLIINEDKKFTYIEPVLRCKLKGRGYTDNGFLFTPVFVEFIL